MVDNISFYKVRLVIYILLLSYNTMGRYHRWIAWVDTTYNTMGKFDVWMNTMGRFHLQYHG